MMNLWKISAIVSASAALATAEPTWKNQLTSPEPGPHPAIAPSVLNFQISWKGMLDSGKLRIEFAPKDADKPGTFVVRSFASSLGPAAALFPYRSSLWSELDPVSLKPKYFKGEETDSSENVTSTTKHFPDHIEFHEVTKPIKKGSEVVKDRVFTFSPVFDIFSAMLHVRSQKLDDGDKINLLVHPFGTPYLLHVNVLGHEAHLDRKAIRLSVSMQKINRKTMEIMPYKKMKSAATLWLSDDDDRIPLEFRAAVFIGDVRATMTGFQKT